MLPKKQRFTKKELGTFLSQKGLFTAYNGLGTLKYTQGNKKLAVVTSGKHEKRAVVRNRMRRRVYTLWNSTKGDYCGVFYLSKQSYLLDYEKTKLLFDDLFKKITK